MRRFIEKIDDGLTKSEVDIWSVLFAAGYLTRRRKAEGRKYQLAIPNREIRNIFKGQIMAMFKAEVVKEEVWNCLFQEKMQGCFRNRETFVREIDVCEKADTD